MIAAAAVLRISKIQETLGQATEDWVAAFGMSARPREWSPQVLELRVAGARAGEHDGPVAFVFGNEQAGLTNEEMFACQYLVHIPASAEFSSLNLAQAVQVVAYELFMASGPFVLQPASEKLATLADIEGLYAHLHDAAVKSGFHVPEAGPKLPERLRRLFSRVPELTREEVNIVRGLLKALLGKKRSKQPPE